MTEKQIAAGIICHDGKVLIGQRKKGKDLEFFWELPGGKLEEGETLEECLKRELIKELDLKIEVMRNYFYILYAKSVVKILQENPILFLWKKYLNAP